MKASAPPLAERRRAGLSETLVAHPRRPDRCQACGRDGALDGLRRWQEHDGWDRPVHVVVVLCHPCGERIVEPHARLYRNVEHHAPWPGAMPLCVYCQYRGGLDCGHRDLKANGGAGLSLRFPKPTRAYLNYGGGRGEWKTLYSGPVKTCAGQDLAT